MPNTNTKTKIQHAMLALMTKARSRGLFVFLMLKYVPSNPPAVPIIPPTMPPISPGFISRLSFCDLIWPKSRFYGNKCRIPSVTEEKPAKGYEIFWRKKAGQASCLPVPAKSAGSLHRLCRRASGAGKMPALLYHPASAANRFRISSSTSPGLAMVSAISARSTSR